MARESADPHHDSAPPPAPRSLGGARGPAGPRGDVGLRALERDRLTLAQLPVAGGIAPWAVQVRRALRVPGMVRCGPVDWWPVPGDMRAAYAPVDGPTFEQIRLRFRESRAWDGIHLRRHPRAVAAHNQGAPAGLEALARLVVRLPEGPVALCAVLALGDMDEGQQVILRQRAAGALLEAGVTLRGEGIRPVIMTEPTAPVLLRQRGPREGPAMASLDGLLGPEACAHPRGLWEMTTHEDAIELSCPDCCHRRLGVVGLHRLPEGHPLLPAGRKAGAYLTRVRALAQMREDRRPVVSLGQLRERDGVVTSLDPAAFALVAPVRRAVDLRGALGARRSAGA